MRTQVTFYFYFVVIGLAGNKEDLYSSATTTEEEASEYAKEIGATFKLTSALKNVGIDALYYELAEKYIKMKKEKDNNEKNITLHHSNNKKKGGCCLFSGDSKENEEIPDKMPIFDQ